MKIHVLSPEVYNQIAAGEVIDRPYSVVKELVENAIDAGATEVTLEIEMGGKQLIRVTDNGVGIAKEDLANAFEPHATSKLTTAADLFGVTTLGFRGEALASIASVSKTKICSRVQGEDAFSLSSEGGVRGEVLPAAGAYGTQISVCELFFNTPARLKFLKSDAQEEGDIAGIVARFILSRPAIAFTLITNGKIKYRSFGDGLPAALAAIYGADILSHCYEIDADKHGIRLYGYIGDRNFSKSNRTYQSLFVNGRYVINQTVSSAVTNAYAGYLMKRQYPFYVLFLDIPPEIVDVNVHPNKADVRFADNQVIYGTVYSVISSVLDGNSRALEYLVDANRQQERAEEREEREKPAQQAEGVFAAPISPASKPAPAAKPAPAPQMTYAEAKKELEFQIPPQAGRVSVPPRGNWQLEMGVSQPTQKEVDVFEENKRSILEAEKKKQQQRIDPASLEFKGELFRTYLIYECGDDAYIVDQHAAHERLIYDRLREKAERREILSQPMLVPFILTVNPAEFAFLEKQLPVLRELGFDIDEFGTDAVKVSAVPSDLLNMDMAAFFDEILSSYESLRAIKLADLLKDKLASAACKAAVKGGDPLTEEEVKALLRRMNGDMGLKCPHGRPVAVHVARSEFEKLFKRIV